MREEITKEFHVGRIIEMSKNITCRYIHVYPIILTVTVMGKNTLHHLGEGGEDEAEDDRTHSDKGEAPQFSVGALSQLWKPH